MALIKCPECGKEISDSAKQCPHCGYKSRNLNDLPDIGGAFSSVLSFIYSLFKDGRYWKALIILAISVTLGVLSIYYAFESWCMDWILFVGGILLCLTGTLILFVRPIEFSRNRASGRVMKYSMFLLILGSFAIVSHGVVRVINPHAFSYYDEDYKYNNSSDNDSERDGVSQGSQRGSVTGTYTFDLDGEVYKVVLNEDNTAQLIYETGTTYYGHWRILSFGPDAQFEIRTPTLENPYLTGKIHIYFREGYTYFDYDQVMSKSPVKRFPYAKTK